MNQQNFQSKTRNFYAIFIKSNVHLINNIISVFPKAFENIPKDL